ncbi:uncharacterized protein LOC132192493 [Neocloeon triangulifer]|uniref:uncharacterized protein LOC132192493 n=1 Tax=Neocloeon triangulifer TaxID=2078957 RepID=UPI00286F9EC7|nr:uncharacterized protein LOC132192493 [Neocloeon triangulifer]
MAAADLTDENNKMRLDSASNSVQAATVQDDDQPIDLSKPAKDGQQAVTSHKMFVKKRWLAQSQTAGFVPLNHIRTMALKRRAHEMSSSSFTTTTTTSTTEDSTYSRQWELEMRLDRANSLPYLSALPPLQRQKSLSESRIPPKASQPVQTTLPASPLNSSDDRTVRWLIEHQQEVQRQRMQQLDLLQQQFAGSPEPSTEINLNYYTKMVQFMQSQEAERAKLQAPTVEEDDGYDENDDEECAELAEIDYSSSPSQSGEIPGDEHSESKRKATGTRPMTGKHVRSGTGAKPSTLLELRKKIQARQQMKMSPIK